MPHAFPAYLGTGYFDATFIADDSLIPYSLILTAVTFEVIGWTKNSLTEKAITFWLQGTVIDGLRLDDLAV